MPSSTTESITPKARLEPCTKRSRNRNHTTSSASRAPPQRNAAARKRIGSGREPTALVEVGSGGAAGRRAARASALAAAIAFSEAAATPVPRRPSQPISATSPARAPSTAPSVFIPYSSPSTRPNSRERSARPGSCSARTSTGSVAPIAVAGSSIRPNAASRRTALRAHASASNRRNTGASVGVRDGKPRTRARPVTPMIASRAPYTRSGRRTDGVYRAARPFPSARPAMKLASTRLDAHTVLPKARPARRNQRVSKSRAAAPESSIRPESAAVNPRPRAGPRSLPMPARPACYIAASRSGRKP